MPDLTFFLESSVPCLYAVVLFVQLELADESWLTIQCYVMIGDGPDMNILTRARTCKQGFQLDVITIFMSEEQNRPVTKAASRDVRGDRVNHIIRLRSALTLRIAPISV